MVRYRIFDVRNSMDALHTTVGVTQDLVKIGHRFFASDYAEPVVHLTQNVAYLAKEAPGYCEVIWVPRC